MKKTRPLKPEEIVEDIRPSFLFDRQIFQKGSKLKIQRICMLCGNEFVSVASQIRSDLKRGRSVTGYCSNCLRLPGEHQRNIQHRRKPNGFKNTSGYVLVHTPDHPFAGKHGHVLQHRLVMEKSLGRYLEPEESVHHINGIRDDNRIENLELRSGQHGMGVKRVCLDCGSHNVIAVKLS